MDTLRLDGYGAKVIKSRGTTSGNLRFDVTFNERKIIHRNIPYFLRRPQYHDYNASKVNQLLCGAKAAFARRRYEIDFPRDDQRYPIATKFTLTHASL